MKVKTLLPIPRRGQSIDVVDTDLSFYEIYKNELLKNDIDISMYQLVNSVGQALSYSRPLSLINAYPGICLELRKIPDIDQNTALLQPVLDAKTELKINFNLSQIGEKSFF